jgi:hypothetical protein
MGRTEYAAEGAPVHEVPDEVGIRPAGPAGAAGRVFDE